MAKPVLITGASGNQGGPAARCLLELGMPVRVAGTRPDALRAAFPSMQAVRLDLTDPASFAPALDGVGSVFLLRPPAIAKMGPTLNAFLDEAQRLGVDHVVLSSVAGAERNKHIPHRKAEDHLQASLLDWTILRPGFFAQNLTGAYRIDIAEDDRIYVPAGAGKAAFIDTRDIGEVAAEVLAQPEAHVGKAYWLTGGEALSFAEVAALLEEELSRSIRYVPASALGYVRYLRKRHRLGWMQTIVQTALHLGLRRGDAEGCSGDVERLLGRPPRTMREFIEDHHDAW